MLRGAVLLLLVLLCAGCPGQRRPDPRIAERLKRAAGPSESPQTRTTEPGPRTPAERLDALAEGLARLEEQKTAFEGASTQTAWKKLVAEIDALQTEAFALQEVEDDALLERLYPLLERVELIRADVVSSQPD